MNVFVLLLAVVMGGFVNGSWEDGETGWTKAGSLTSVQTDAGLAFDGVNLAFVGVTAPGPEAYFEQTLSLPHAGRWTIYVWAQIIAGQMNNATFDVRVDQGAGFEVIAGPWNETGAGGASVWPTNSWAVVEITHTFTTATPTVRFYVDRAGESQALTLFDLAEISKMRGRYDGYNALFTLIDGITGAGYHHDLSGKTFRVLVTPEDAKGLPSPWACMPLLGEPEDYPEIEEDDRHVKARWRQTIFVFVEETDAGDLDGKSVEMIQKARDDIHKAILSDPDLSGNVRELRPVSARHFAGEEPGVRWAELQFEVEVMQYFQSDDLGP